MANSDAGFQNRIRTSSVKAEASALMMSVRYGPMKFDTMNCASAKLRPHSAAAGHTAIAPLHPAMSTTRYIGMDSARAEPFNIVM